MKEENNIPSALFNKLSDLVGRERAKKYIHNVGHSYNAVMLTILYFECKHFLKKHPFILIIILVIITLFLFL